IQLLKSVSIRPFASIKAAHSTAAFQSVKLFFEEFFLSTQPLALSIRSSSLQREAHSTAFKSAVNHLFHHLRFPIETPRAAHHPPAGASYTPTSDPQTLHST
ncbi:hypothetical protein, partial [Pseudomonas sp. NCCP-436]|uniref:hypothetical protein n=1 Tax=Pseudomonas sp. NCCP-436 TaxID=2842481 RepID=UPI001C80400C